MSEVQVFDRPMCCSTGICGPNVDPVLPRFASDLQWLKGQGHRVERFNLAQQPAEFAEHPLVQQMLENDGVECLPLVLVDGRVVSRSDYPTRENLALWTGAALSAESLPVVSEDGCRGDCGCC